MGPSMKWRGAAAVFVARKGVLQAMEKAAKELKEANRERFKKGLLGQLRKTVTWK